MESLLDIYKHLNQLGYVLRPFTKEDEDDLYEIFRATVSEGGQFHYESSSLDEFREQFLKQSQVYVCHSSSHDVCGGFYIRSNDSSSQIANAAYMVKDIHRKKGIGSLLVKASLYLAKELGFQAMQFNKVLSQNSVAISLYQKLGFKIIKTSPRAYQSQDGSFQDVYVMYRKLDDL